MLGACEVRELRVGRDDLLADSKESVRALAVDELGVLADAVGARHGLPDLRRQVERVIVRLARVRLLRGGGRRDRQESEGACQKPFRASHTFV